MHEKNVRHGRISTLHIWPARRPLATCRAALIATLLPDPGDKTTREEILTRLADRVEKTVKKTKLPSGKIEEIAAKETVGCILHWGRESSPDLEWFGQEIRKNYGGRARSSNRRWTMHFVSAFWSVRLIPRHGRPTWVGAASVKIRFAKSAAPGKVHAFGVKVASAELETNEIQDLADSIGEIKKAAAGQCLKFSVTIELGDSANVPQGVVDDINALLGKVHAGWRLQ